MDPQRRRCFLYVIFAALFVSGSSAVALEFQPGIGVAAEYTDNAELSSENTVNDLITVAYVGASLSENEGALIYNANASFNKQTYTQDTFEDQRYFDLAASANWEMVRDRFNWNVSDTFGQRTINTLDPNTPDNLQDSNVFALGADILFPISARQRFSLAPLFSQFYFEQQSTNNKQYSLSVNWNYQMSRLTSMGLNFSTRTVNYNEQVIADTRFTTAALVFNGQRSRSDFSINLGSTNVKRDNGQETTGFSGSLNWLVNLSSRSTFITQASTNLTDTATVALAPDGGGSDVQVTADVIRNTVANVTYQRKGTSLQSTVSAGYNKVRYSESPLDQIVRSLDIQFTYPLTRLLSGSAYTNYSRIKRLDTDRVDQRYTLGSNVNYRFSRKLQGSLDLKYRKTESTLAIEDFDEYSAFVSLVYGFGNVQRPSRTGGF